LHLTGFSLATSIDNALPLIPEFVYIYMSMYLVAILPYFFIQSKKEFTNVMASYLLVLASSFMIFIFFPVYMPRPELIATTFSEKLLTHLYLIDLPINNFPSLHVALSMLSSFILYKYSKKIGVLALIWSVLIALSVLLVKQHYFLDVIAGVLIAVIGYLFYTKGTLWSNRK
jgi:membrane-associated phospholipid phosphatase